jgi:hypothetical protein
LRQPEARRESPGADAKSEQPVCEKAVAFTLGGLQALKLFALLAQHFHVEVAVGFDPILVDRQGPESAGGTCRQSEGSGAAKTRSKPCLTARRAIRVEKS